MKPTASPDIDLGAGPAEPASVIYRCHHIGVAGTTGVFIRQSGGLYYARVGVAILGMTNLSADELGKVNPFDDDFADNYVEGVGPTEALSLANLGDELAALAASIWH